jgi:hypothetical protein
MEVGQVVTLELLDKQMITGVVQALNDNMIILNNTNQADPEIPVMIRGCNIKKVWVPIEE